MLASKRTIDSLSNSNREELLNSSAVSEKRDLNEKVTDDALMAANDNVNDAMQRTLTLLEGELNRSVLSAQMLGMQAQFIVYRYLSVFSSRLYRDFAVHFKHP